MLVNKTSIEAVFLNLRTLFNKAFGETESSWEKIATRVPSTTAQEIYTWFSNWPMMRKWIGDKIISKLKAYKYAVTNDDFEVTVEVDRNDIEDDTLGQYGPQATGSGMAAKTFPDELLADAINGAFATECFDGQYFIDTDHPVSDKNGNVSSVSNKGVAVLSAASQAAAMASFGAGQTAMESFKSDEGRPLGVSPDVLMVGPALRAVATILMTAERLEDGKPNLYRGACEVVVNPRITSTTAWFLLDTKKPIKPFIYQERKKPVFVKQTDPESDNVFMRKKYRFGAEARGAAGYTFWQLIYGSTGAGA